MPFLDDGNAPAHLQELMRLALVEDDPTVRNAILRQLSLIINKVLPPSSIPQATDLLWKPSTGLLHTSSIDENTVRTIFWIAKALVLRLASTDEVLSHVLSLLSSPDHGLSSARGFALLLAPDEIFSKQNGATIRLLSKQRVFNICVPRLASEFRNADPSLKANYLIALSGILAHVSTSVLLPEIGTLLPLLLQSLDLPEAEVKAATIDTLTTIVVENPSAVETHVNSLVTRLLAAAGDQEGNPARTRKAALRCLRMFPGKIKESTLLPFRGKVTWGLGKSALDDRRREVRREAIDCRAKWLEMDEPESE